MKEYRFDQYFKTLRPDRNEIGFNTIMRIAVVLLWTVTPMWAQLSDLSTTDDGSSLVFRSTMRFKGSADVDEDKIFRWNGGSYAVVARAHSPARDPLSLNPPHLGPPALSGDGKVLAYYEDAGCSLCQIKLPSAPYINGMLALADPVYISFLLSHNGRYAAYDTAIWDLTRAVKLSSRPLPQNPRVFGIADDSSLLVFDALPRSLSIITEMASIPIIADPTLLTGMISADASKVLYSTADGLFVFDTVGKTSELVSGPGSLPAGLSVDGKRGVFVSTTTFRDAISEVWFVDFTTGNRMSLGNIRGPGIGWAPDSERPPAAISGNGLFVWLMDSNGRLAQIQVDTAQYSYVSEPLPAFTRVSSKVTPGSLFRLLGLPELTPANMNGASNLHITAYPQFRDEGRDLPIIDVGPGYIGAQVPWEFTALQTSNGINEIASNGLYAISKTEGQFEVLIADLHSSWGPAYELRSGILDLPQSPQQAIKASHEDFRGLVTEDDPAHPGEIVHIYMTGLGPVSEPQTTGLPAPVTPLARVTGSLTAGFLTSSNFATALPAEVLFSGLIPGTVGLYQVDLIIPSNVPDSALLLITLNTTLNNTIGRLPIAATGSADVFQ